MKIKMGKASSFDPDVRLKILAGLNMACSRPVHLWVADEHRYRSRIRVVLPKLSAAHPELLLIASIFHHY